MTASFTIPKPELWSKLSLKIRQRWWRETDYGRVAPNEDLIKAIERDVQQTNELIEKEKVLHDATQEPPAQNAPHDPTD